MHIEREREKSLLRTSLLKFSTTKTTGLVANRALIRYRAKDTIIFEIEIPSSFLRLPAASIAGKSICFPSYEKRLPVVRVSRTYYNIGYCWRRCCNVKQIKIRAIINRRFFKFSKESASITRLKKKRKRRKERTIN